MCFYILIGRKCHYQYQDHVFDSPNLECGINLCIKACAKCINVTFIGLHHLHTGRCSLSPLFFATLLKLTQVTWRSTHKFSFGLSSGLQDIKIVVLKPFLCSFVLYARGSLACRNTNQVFLQDFPVFYCIHLFTLYPNKPSRPFCRKASTTMLHCEDVVFLMMWSV